jgi:hypothetical protein
MEELFFDETFQTVPDWKLTSTAWEVSNTRGAYVTGSMRSHLLKKLKIQVRRGSKTAEFPLIFGDTEVLCSGLGRLLALIHCQQAMAESRILHVDPAFSSHYLLELALGYRIVSEQTSLLFLLKPEQFIDNEIDCPSNHPAYDQWKRISSANPKVEISSFKCFFLFYFFFSLLSYPQQKNDKDAKDALEKAKISGSEVKRLSDVLKEVLARKHTPVARKPLDKSCAEERSLRSNHIVLAESSLRSYDMVFAECSAPMPRASLARCVSAAPPPLPLSAPSAPCLAAPPPPPGGAAPLPAAYRARSPVIESDEECSEECCGDEGSAPEPVLHQQSQENSISILSEVGSMMKKSRRKESSSDKKKKSTAKSEVSSSSTKPREVAAKPAPPAPVDPSQYLLAYSALSSNPPTEKALELYRAYRGGNKMTPSFYFNTAREFLEKNVDKRLCVQILTNALEINVQDLQMFRSAAYFMLQLDFLSQAIMMFEQVMELAPEEPQSFLDLGLAHFVNVRRQKEKVPSQPINQEELTQAIELVTKVLGKTWQSRFAEIEYPALVWLNWMVGYGKHHGLKNDFYPKILEENSLLIEGFSLSLIISMGWDTDHVDIDLHVHEPLGFHVYYGSKDSDTGGHLSKDFTQGYGPEVYIIKPYVPGAYQARVRYFASHQDSKTTGATSAVVWRVINLGQWDKEDVLFRCVRLTVNQSEHDVLTAQLPPLV